MIPVCGPQYQRSKILADGGSVIPDESPGRPKDGPTDKYSLRHLVSHLQSLLGDRHPVQFANDCIGASAVDMASSLKGEVLLLRKPAFYKEEEKGDEAFAEN